MNTTIKQIAEATAAINVLMGAKLPVKAAYAVSKLAKLCSNEMEHFGKQRDKVFEDRGCTITETENKDANGEPIKEWSHPDGKEAMAAVLKEIDEMMQSAVEISAVPLDIEQFGDADVPGGAFFGLDWAMKQ